MNASVREGIEWKPFLRQLFVCSAMWSCYFMFGLSIGCSTVIIPQLRKEANSTDAVSEEVVGWMTSVTGYSAIIFAFINIFMAYLVGARKCLIIGEVITFIAFTIVFCSKNATHVIISQFIQGLPAALHTTVIFMVLTEYTSPKYRGIFLTIKSATFMWGIWVANAVGTFFHYKYIGICGIVCSLYSFLALLCFPESPYWLARKGKYDECIVSHQYLKGTGPEADKELKDLLNYEKELKQRSQPMQFSLYNFKETMTNLSQPEIYKPLALIVLAHSSYHSSGKLIYTTYSIQMLQKLTLNQSTAYTGMLILDGVSVCAMYFGCYLSKIFKRRPLLLVASSIATLSLFTMSVYLYLVRLSIIIENSYISISLLAFFSLAISCGPMILASSICSELTPIKYRLTCLCFSTIYVNCILGTSLKMSPLLFRLCGFDGTFLVFGICSSICIILIYKYLPETKDKTLLEIADYFKKKEAPHDATELMPIKISD